MLILSCDHGAFDVMQKLMAELKEKNVKFKYLGPKKLDPEDDYPDFAMQASEEVLKKKDNIGIFMCGSGIGVNMVANRYKGIRAVCASNEKMARMARLHEDANVLTMGARFLSYGKIKKIIKAFLETEFEGGRHARRIAKY